MCSNPPLVRDKPLGAPGYVRPALPHGIVTPWMQCGTYFVRLLSTCVTVSGWCDWIQTVYVLVKLVGFYIDGLVQERRNSSALAMELRLSCTNPSICIMSYKPEAPFINMDKL